MVVTARRANETREMRLLTKVIELSKKTKELSLPEFIAVRRQPDSEQWKTWDEITIALYEVTGEVITDVSLRRWAERYGIPEITQPEGSPVTPDQYREILAEHSIKI